MDRGKGTGSRSGNRHGWAPSSSGSSQRSAYPPPVMPRPSSRTNSGLDNNLSHCYSSSDNMNPYECIDEELQLQQHGRHHNHNHNHGSGVGGYGVGGGGGGPAGYHLGSSSREGLDILGPNIGYLEQSGSEGDGEEESPPVHHRKPGGGGSGHPHAHGVGGGSTLGGGGVGGGGQSQSHSLRRLNRARFGGGGGGGGGSGGVSQALLPNNENPYQQPYLSGRLGAAVLSGGGGLSDSPISNASDDVTLTDSELQFANQSNSTNLHSSALPPLQNGGIMMSGNLDYLGGVVGGGGGLGNRGNSLKRTTLNSNGKSTTGIGLISHGGHGGNSSSNHESLMENQFIMQTPGGKIYIPQGDHMSKNSSSDYKGSPGSSPCKKSSSLLYKEGLHMGMSGLGGGGLGGGGGGGGGDGRGGCMDATLRELTLRPRATKLPTDDVDFLYKMRGYCTRNRVVILVLSITLLLSLLFNVLLGTGTVDLRSGGLGGAGGCGNIISVGNSEYSHAVEQTDNSSGWRQSWDKGQGIVSNNNNNNNNNNVHRYNNQHNSVNSPIPTSAEIVDDDGQAVEVLHDTVTRSRSSKQKQKQNSRRRRDAVDDASSTLQPETQTEPSSEDDNVTEDYENEESNTNIDSGVGLVMSVTLDSVNSMATEELELSTRFSSASTEPEPVSTSKTSTVESSTTEEVTTISTTTSTSTLTPDKEGTDLEHLEDPEWRSDPDPGPDLSPSTTSASTSTETPVTSSSEPPSSVPTSTTTVAPPLTETEEIVLYDELVGLGGTDTDSDGDSAQIQGDEPYSNLIRSPPLWINPALHQPIFIVNHDDARADARPNPPGSGNQLESNEEDNDVVVSPPLQEDTIAYKEQMHDNSLEFISLAGEFGQLPSSKSNNNKSGMTNEESLPAQVVGPVDVVMISDSNESRQTPDGGNYLAPDDPPPITADDAHAQTEESKSNNDSDVIENPDASLASLRSQSQLVSGIVQQTSISSLITSFLTPTTSRPHSRGAICECYCPCLDKMSGEESRDDDDDGDYETTENVIHVRSNGTTTDKDEDLEEDSLNGSGSGSGSGFGPLNPRKMPRKKSRPSQVPVIPILDEDGSNDDEDSWNHIGEEMRSGVLEGSGSGSGFEPERSNNGGDGKCSCSGGGGGGGRPFPATNFPPESSSFREITLGSRHQNTIGQYGYWNMQFYQPSNQYVTLELSVPRGASIGFYARRNALPTHTHYDIVEIIRGFKTSGSSSSGGRPARSSPPSVSKEISNFLEEGHWFISIYNDDSDPQQVVFGVSVSEEMNEGCPNGCSGNGQCQAGHCECNPGFGGEDCSRSVCPVLCSGRGDYVNGECSCNPGWKGKECNLHHDECEVSDCSGHGKCINGKCNCLRGYKGEFCQEVDCANPTCSGHGFCMAGSCMCKKGWRGADCSEPDNEALQCLPDCSSHGSFSLETQTCTCEPRWTGEDCSQELCDTNCGPNGVCIGTGCQCSDGWTGTLCNQRVCDKRCAEHGQCKNGTCLCVTGWNGKHCTLEGCPNSCSGHGQCKANQEGLWECKCHSGWNGPECSVMLEQNCNDAKDNDKDGLTDCEDPECCSQDICSKSQLCVSARKPIDILLRKQPPAITASFFEKMKFLIEEGSLQNYARQDAFNGSRSGVVRGRVVTPNGSGLMGVRVSSSSPLEPLGGFTLTQDDGSFDLMVNGGGAVTLLFGRSPFNAKTRTIFVPWNEVVIVDTIAMGSSDDKLYQHSQPCDAHDYELMKPVILATWKHGFQGDCPDASVILAESQVVQETLRIPGTGLNLMYHSSRTPGYSSTIELQLTSDVIPPTLKRVHLRITIEGVLFEKIFEGDPNVKYTYSWNRLNYYRQRVYGVTTAIVKVGYEYENCANTIWDVQSTTLSGHDMSISEIGGWNLDIHHRFNFHEGIIQKGDGTNIYLKYRPRVILTTMGNGYQRPLDCVADCNGIAAKQKLLAPVALAAAADGTLFVGDFNLIRRVMVDGTVRNVVVRNATRVSYRYHIALSPVDNMLYISDPESHQIIRVKNAEETQNPEYNWEVVVGSGERCLPGDEAHCGDEALARDAKLTYPKGVAISADNILYFADGTNIRKVDRDGIITTVIGNHQQKAHWKPIPCEGTLKVEEVHLRWPTDLAINPLDNSLYIIDDHMILKLTDDNRIRIIAGRPIQCLTPFGGFENDLATHTTLISPQSMTFAPNGDLYVAESDSQRISRVRLITTDGRIGHFAGAESKCNCLDRDCSCFDEDHYLAATTKFNTISSIVMAPNGILHIADQGNHRIRSVQALIPSSTQPSESKQYEVYFPETQEIYIFNRFGQHIATKNIITGETVYTFLYNVNMSNGKLISVTDSIGNKIQILRDISLQVKSIENPYGQKFNVKISRKGMLQEWSTPEGYNVTFNYHGSTGLLKSRQDSSGRSSIYSYDEFGRLIMAISPTGQIITLNFDLNSKGATVKITKDQDHSITLLIKGSTLFKRVGKLEHVTSIQPDGSVIRLYPWSQVATTESVPYNVLGELNPVLSDSFPITGKQKVEIANELMNRIEWRYIARKEGKGKHKQIVQIDKKLRVNGDNILMVEYDRESKSELIFIDDRNEILNVSYDRIGRPLKWTPNHGFAPVELDYDRYGRLIEWKWADLTETYEYDRSGRLFKIRYSDGTSLSHTFKDSLTTLPSKMTTGGQSDYLLEYDDSGSFQSLTTPRGHIHTFGVSTSVGVYEYQYKSPSSRDMYKIQYNDAGHILSIIYPSNSGRINYIYNKHGRLEVTLGGLHSATYAYQEASGLLKVVDVIQANFEVKIEYKYHGGLVKEQRHKFGSRTGLDNTHIKYQFDGNGRITTIDVEVNGRPIQSLVMKKNQNTGVLELVHDLAVLKTVNMFNRTIIQDTTTKTYFHTVERDEIGRPASKLVHLNGKEVYRLQIEYNNHGRIKHRKLIIGRSVYTDSITYDADGHVTAVVGSGSWKYNYDENGNIIQIMEQEEKSSLIYDTGDRVVQVGELLRYTYDSRGFLIQRGNEKFQYDDNGLLIHAIKKDGYKVWFFYDHLSRLISTRDDQGNVTQFLYTNLEADSQHLVTHIHYPTSNRSILCLYDEHEHLIGLVTQSGGGERYYVATDQNGSPIALFNIHGVIVKEIHRSPFGKTVRDTSTHFNLPIDYFGGILDKHSGLIIINGRPYDSSIGQWMTPSWAQLPSTLNVPTDIFTYRFHQNDPISPANTAARLSAKMTTLAEWAKLFGYSVPRIFGLNYLRPSSLEPAINSALLNPEFNTVSGLDCIADTIGNEFKTFGFYRESKLNPERLMFTNKNHQRKSSLLVNSKFAYRPTTLFGSGLLVSRMSNGRTLISTVDNSVVQGVLTSVLNGSVFIDLKSTHSNTFFFIKDNPLKLRDDLEELKRLGGLYNISIHEVENGVKELRLSNGDSSIAVRYGTELDEEYQRLVKHAHRRAIERAWEDEKFALSLGLDGRRLWSDEEREQLLSKGSVHGYRPSDLYSVHKYPQLADDPNNVAFLKDSRRKRRKSHSNSNNADSEHETGSGSGTFHHHPHHPHVNQEDSSTLHFYDSTSS